MAANCPWSWIESWGQSLQLNPCEKHGPGLSRSTMLTTQSSLLVGTIPTSTSLSLKYKCLRLLVASHMWRMRRHLKLKDLLFTTGYTTNVRTQLLGANTKSSEHRSNKSDSESSSSVAMSVHCYLHWFSHLKRIQPCSIVFAQCCL